MDDLGLVKGGLCWFESRPGSTMDDLGLVKGGLCWFESRVVLVSTLLEYIMIQRLSVG